MLFFHQSHCPSWFPSYSVWKPFVVLAWINDSIPERHSRCWKSFAKPNVKMRRTDQKVLEQYRPNRQFSVRKKNVFPSFSTCVNSRNRTTKVLDQYQVHEKRGWPMSKSITPSTTSVHSLFTIFRSSCPTESRLTYPYVLMYHLKCNTVINLNLPWHQTSVEWAQKQREPCTFGFLWRPKAKTRAWRNEAGEREPC